ASSSTAVPEIPQPRCPAIPPESGDLPSNSVSIGRGLNRKESDHLSPGSSACPTLVAHYRATAGIGLRGRGAHGERALVLTTFRARAMSPAGGPHAAGRANPLSTAFAWGSARSAGGAAPAGAVPLAVRGEDLPEARRLGVLQGAVGLDEHVQRARVVRDGRLDHAVGA